MLTWIDRCFRWWWVRGASLSAMVLTAVILLAGRHASSEETIAAGITATPVERYVLENGLEVLLQPDARATRVALVVCYHSGSLVDPEGLAGLAHVAEHMSFRGSRHLADGQMFALPQRWGATDANAVTKDDATLYMAVFPPEQLPPMIWLESERMGFVLEALSAEHLELERKIIRNELALRRGPNRRISALLDELSYPKDHPLHAAARMDLLDEVGAVDLPALQWLYQGIYRPDNASVILVGNFDAGVAKTSIQNSFGPIRNPNLPRLAATVAAVAFTGTARARMAAPDNVERLRMIWTLPVGVIDAQRVALHVLSVALERRVREWLEHERHISATVSGQLERGLGGDRFVFEVEIPVREQLPLVEHAIDGYLAPLRAQPIAERELDELRQQAKWSLLTGLEPTLPRALQLALDREPGSISKLADLPAFISELDALSAVELLAAARALLPRERRLIVEVIAKKSARNGGELLSVEGALFGATGRRP
jgi:zinc protease